MEQVLHLQETLLQERTDSLDEFLTNAQGEDVVAGVRTPMHIYRNGTEIPGSICISLKKYAILWRNHYRDMQDMEFTVEDR